MGSIWDTPLLGQLIRGITSVPLWAAEAVMTEKSKRFGYFCKDSDYRKTTRFT